jgi:hypothetical protein
MNLKVLLCLKSLVLLELGYKATDETTVLSPKESVIFVKRVEYKSLTMTEEEILQEYNEIIVGK